MSDKVHLLNSIKIPGFAIATVKQTFVCFTVAWQQRRKYKHLPF